MKNFTIDEGEKKRIIQQLSNDTSTLDECVAQFEVKLIRQALLDSGGNKAKAAEILGVPASTLKSKIKKYGIV